jgi:hypothetical protein
VTPVYRFRIHQHTKQLAVPLVHGVIIVAQLGDDVAWINGQHSVFGIVAEIHKHSGQDNEDDPWLAAHGSIRHVDIVLRRSHTVKRLSGPCHPGQASKSMRRRAGSPSRSMRVRLRAGV